MVAGEPQFPDPLRGPSGLPRGCAEVSSSATGKDPWQHRLQVAREVGLYLRRALNGRHRGVSGRSKIDLPSRCYVVVQDKYNNRYEDPVKVAERFGEVKSLCFRGASPENSIFVKLPSSREAKEAVASAGLKWPAGYQSNV